MKTFNVKNSAVIGLVLASSLFLGDSFAEGAGSSVTDSSVSENHATNVKSIGGGSGGIDLGFFKGGNVNFGNSATETNVNSIVAKGGGKVSGSTVTGNEAKDITNVGTELNVNSIIAK
jgi:hypothetical protein